MFLSHLLLCIYFNFKGSFWGEPDWKAGDAEDALARKAYEALLRVSLLQPTTDRFQEFTDEVKERSWADYNFTINEDEEVRIVYRKYQIFTIIVFLCR